jgi:hypothetical protein
MSNEDDDQDEFEELDAHLDAEALRFGTDYMAALYKNLRASGLRRLDAAAVLAAMIAFSESPDQPQE